MSVMSETAVGGDGGRWGATLGSVLGEVRVTQADRGDEPDGRSSVTRVGFVRICDPAADVRAVSRTEPPTAGSPGEFVAFGLPERGTAVLVQGDRTATVGPAELIAWDPALPFTLDLSTASGTRIVRLPRRTLLITDGGLLAATGTVVSTEQGIGPVLKALLDILVEGGSPRSDAVASMSAESVANLFCALLAEGAQLSGADGGDDGDPRGQLLDRIRGHIDDHLADPDLSPGTVARAHHISVRYLHRLFETEGITVARFIKQRRLHRCAQELGRRTASPPTVSSIAQRWGFVNPTHFSRTFRAFHGHTPVQWRALSTATDQDSDAPAVGGATAGPFALSPGSV
ncbi:helix-turn-helix domain-containing protein [Streptomyces sp. NPDC051784]|uniref:helix-turn-helix domain-containing protein n=1 Tax=Streptomyces sp. NPDC051784 TaxID=3155805 RepID=UPI003412FF76